MMLFTFWHREEPATNAFFMPEVSIFPMPVLGKVAVADVGGNDSSGHFPHARYSCFSCAGAGKSGGSRSRSRRKQQ